jgi:hypothetical protein
MPWTQEYRYKIMLTQLKGERETGPLRMPWTRHQSELCILEKLKHSRGKHTNEVTEPHTREMKRRGSTCRKVA